jgi:hypothetical protein
MYFRVKLSIERPDPEVVKGIGAYPTGNICDAMNRTGAMDHKVKPMWKGLRIAGPAVTVNMRVCDNTMMYKALEIAQPGELPMEHLFPGAMGLKNPWSKSTIPKIPFWLSDGSRQESAI